ncbi:MAG: helix-turn-helix transcriptional regulator [Fibrobacterota bacterium]
MNISRMSLCRIYEIDDMIKRGVFYSAESAAEHFQVSKRSIERDLELMRYNLGAEIFYSKQKKRYEYKDKSFSLPMNWLDENEIALVLIAEKALRIYTQTGFSEEIHPVFNKLLQPVKISGETMENVREKCRSVCFYRPFEPVKGLRNEFSIILDCIMNRKKIKMRYRKGGMPEKSERRIEPYTLIYQNKEWQVIGRCLRSWKLKTFSLHRIIKPEMLDRSFVIPDDFDVRDFFHHPFESLTGSETKKIELEIDSPEAEKISEINWHCSQEIEEKKNGGIRLKMQCSVNQNLIDWIFSMKDCVTIKSPYELRLAVKEKALRMAEKNYI